MLKEFKFNLKGNKVRIVNSWFHGMKLYINGEFRDQTKQFFAFGQDVLLSANLAGTDILEVVPKSGLFSLELDVYLATEKERLLVYSSHGRISLKTQRLINE